MTVRVNSWGSGLFPTAPARVLAGFVLLWGIGGCKPDLPSGPAGLPPKPDLSGEWDYRSFDIRLVGSAAPDACAIDGVVLTFERWGDKPLEGHASAGTMKCSGGLDRFSGPLPPYPIRGGGMVYHHVAFSFASDDWRHTGHLSHDTVTAVLLGDTIRRQVFGDTMRGDLTLRSGTLRFTGKFRAVRRPGAGPTR